MSRGRKLLTESWPMVVASVLVMVYMRTDQILLGYFLGARAVGYYSAAVRLSEIWYMIPAIICSTVMPKLLTLLDTDKVLYYRGLQHLYNYFVLVSVGLALVTIPASHWLIRLVYGGAYLPAAAILNVHVWTGVFVFIGVLGGQQLIHEKLIAIEMQRALMGAVVNLVLNLLLIRRFGVVGSAVATLVAQATASYLSDAFSGRTRHLFRMKTRALSGFWMLRAESRPG
jgi:PST family polysaccharide transporter